MSTNWLRLGAAGVAGGALFQWWHVPVPWLLGPMAGGLTLALGAGEPRDLPRALPLAANTLLGAAAGLLVTRAAAATMLASAPAVLAVVAATVALSMAKGYLLTRLARVDAPTSFLGAMPGGATSMVAMSQELGADPRVVAVLQYLRLLLVLLLTPVALQALSGLPLAPAAAVAPGPGPAAALPWAGLLATAACATAAVWLGPLLRLPSPAFFGTMALVAAGQWTGWWAAAVPDWLFNTAIAVMGLTVGARFERRILGPLARVAATETVLVLGLMAACGAMGWVLHARTGVDAVTALLAVAPGGMEAIVAAALAQGADVPLVMVTHLARFLLVVLVAPALVPALARRAR